METAKQMLLRRIHGHCASCPMCVNGQRRRDCEFGQALLRVNNVCEADVEDNPLEVARHLHWDILALASLQVDDDPSLDWRICVDLVIAQKVEFIWALTEVRASRYIAYDKPLSR